MIEHHVNGIELLTEDRGNAPIYLSAFLFDNVYINNIMITYPILSLIP